MPEASLTIRSATPTDDELIAQHFYQMWRDNQVPTEQIRPDWQTVTLEFLATARDQLGYQGYIASLDAAMVGSVGCQLFSGLYPSLIHRDQRHYGYIWGVYVESAYRRQGIGRKLTEVAVEYLRSQHCTHAILHASPWGKPVYEQIGFIPSNEMRLEL
ncbi:GNAT family N-acetyltransferase [Acaryochloris marina]|uniref:GNAT family N-acetyltransferase n=1 Tax=Acaryochloris marina TaxID=155978 RepID=UPI001BAE7A04|nr:GNAT family N-acetyltransferase [Acaryochloris marina]QUY43076.1 GNAT family N-acetyltransferase [Acaryochloris marina S15]